MSIPFVDRNPTKKESERFRLILSTFKTEVDNNP